MPTFIMLTRLNPDAVRSPRGLEQLERDAMKRVREECPDVEWLKRTPEVERSFDQLLLDATAAASAPSKISFTDPDAVIAIDTIDDRAGIGLWTRDDFARHRLLRPD